MVEMPKLSPGLEVRDAGDEVLVYDHRNDKVHVFNRTAGHVLRLCDGARSAQEIASALRATYRGVSETVDGDVAGLIARLAEEQLLAE